MSWFLPFTNPSKPKRRRRSSRSRRKSHWDPQRTILGLKLLAIIGGTAAILIGWVKLEQSLSNYQKTRYRHKIEIGDVELKPCPLWMSPSVKEQLQLIVARWVSSDPMDQNSLSIAAGMLDQSPWVLKVSQLSRKVDGRIAVTATYRQPLALIASPAGLRLIDNEGVLLPGIYSHGHLQLIDLPLITGVQSPAPDECGRLWSGDEIQAAIALITLLGQESYANQITAYDVSSRDVNGLPRLTLYTNRGMVRWGLPPGLEYPKEPDYAVKKLWLKQVAQTRGSIDAGGKIVDIYGQTIQIYHPAAGSQSL